MSRKSVTKKAPAKKQPPKKTKRELKREVLQALKEQPTITPKQYLDALHVLDLTVASKKTAQAFGIGLRQCQRIASGKVAVPVPIAKLVGMYLKHGLQDAA